MFPLRPLGSTGVTLLPCYYGPVRLPLQATPQVMSSLRSVGALPSLAGPPRFLDRSVHARWSPFTPESPPGAPARCFPVGIRLHHLWQTGHSHKCNEAELGSLALRLACSPHEASPAGLLRPALAWLPAERAILRVNSFQLTRSARLNLALQSPQRKRSSLHHNGVVSLSVREEPRAWRSAERRRRA